MDRTRLGSVGAEHLPALSKEQHPLAVGSDDSDRVGDFAKSSVRLSPPMRQ